MSKITGIWLKDKATNIAILWNAPQALEHLERGTHTYATKSDVAAYIKDAELETTVDEIWANPKTNMDRYLNAVRERQQELAEPAWKTIEASALEDVEDLAKAQIEDETNGPDDVDKTAKKDKKNNGNQTDDGAPDRPDESKPTG